MRCWSDGKREAGGSGEIGAMSEMFTGIFAWTLE